MAKKAEQIRKLLEKEVAEALETYSGSFSCCDDDNDLDIETEWHDGQCVVHQGRKEYKYRVRIELCE